MPQKAMPSPTKAIGANSSRSMTAATMKATCETITLPIEAETQPNSRTTNAITGE